MSKPITETNDPLHSALCELISGMSALNMPPQERKHTQQEFYLSEVDENAHHAMEHLRAVAELIDQALKERGCNWKLEQVKEIVQKAKFTCMNWQDLEERQITVAWEFIKELRKRDQDIDEFWERVLQEASGNK